MSLKDIVVFLDPFIDTDTRLKLALDIARAHHARVIGVDVASRGALEGELHAQAGALEEKFSEAIEAAGISGLYRVADQKTKDWKDFYAHYTDLVIASQPSADMPKGLATVTIEDVLLSAGTPMLILPANWQLAPVGRHIALAWNASREATRAVHDSLPFLKAAESVTLFDFTPREDLTDSAPGLMAEHLRQHGVSVDEMSWPEPTTSPINALFAILDEKEIDLIVAGAYGHTRVFEELFGGVSDDLLHQPVMPVLMSH